MKVAVTVLVFCVAALLALGLVMQYSSGMVGTSHPGARYMTMQLGWGILGFAACAVCAGTDYRLWKKAALPLLIVSIILLILVYIPPIGIHRNGASRWVGWYNRSLFQPSEVAKIALILALAWYGERYQRHMGTWKRGVLVPVCIIGVVLGLIFAEPDRGTTILLAAVCGTMLLIAGVRWHFILPPAIAAAGALAFSLWHDPVRIKRIFGWLYPEEHKSGVGYQAYQAMLAFGSGGLTGQGLGNGTQKLGFVPEHHTDFILSIIGEELGLVATLFVVVAFIAIVICGVYIALRAADTFGLLLGSGITFLIGCQAFINIGVVTSALPNKGLPLPFVSYGGSSLVAMLACVGLLLAIARHARPREALSRTRSGDSLSENPFRGDNDSEEPDPRAEGKRPR
jgi:cell division protein FtsW